VAAQRLPGPSPTHNVQAQVGCLNVEVVHIFVRQSRLLEIVVVVDVETVSIRFVWSSVELGISLVESCFISLIV